MANTQITTQTQTQNSIEVLTTDIKRAWLAYEQANNASDNTLKAYEKGLEVWETWLKDNGITGIVAPSDVVDFKAALLEGYSPQTVNLRLSAVRSFYRFLVNTNRLPFNPASEVKGAKRKKSTTHKRDALTTNEVRCLLDNCNLMTTEGLRDYAIISLMAYCGLREIEVHRANLEDLRTVGERLVLFVQGKGHTEKDEYVVIPASQESFIRQWYRQRKVAKSDDPLFVSLSNRNFGARMSTRAIRNAVMGVYAVCGIIGAKKTTHSLRHTAITNAIRNGASPMQVQAMARHASFDTTLNYIHEVNRIDNPAEDLIEY